MQAELISIGDELLIGQTLDTNSNWIAGELNKIGISVFQIKAIQDKRSHILNALQKAQLHAEIVIITGGLGPTNDDITKKTLTDYFNDELILNVDILDHIRKMFAKVNYPFTEVNKNQALVPSKCIAFKNNYGTAPGMWFEKNNKIVISLPGVPNEMKGLMLDYVLPKFLQDFKLPTIINRTILTYGMGESMVAARIKDWEQNLPESISLAYLPSYGRLNLRLSVKGTNKEQLEKRVAAEVKKLEALIPDIIIGIDEGIIIEAEIGKLLSERNQKLAIAESCTGGNIAKSITAVPGSSAYFSGAIVAYNSAIKMSELNVSKSSISQFSVVSSQVAEEMAKGIQQKFAVDYAIATTGNAGPTSDLTNETIGTVFIAIAGPEGVFSKKYFFGKPREKVVERTSIKALEMLRKEILKNK